MSMDQTRTINNSGGLRRELSREAISLALKGEWERAAEVNQAILELYAYDVDAMNRLGKAFTELVRYGEAKEVLDRVVGIAPYNIIAKKNLARLTRLESTPAPSRTARKTGGAPHLFIEESGKSGTTVLQKPAARQVVARVSPSDPANLVVEQNAIKVYTRDEEYLGQIEPKLGKRLIGLIHGGNRYDAAVVGVHDMGISIIIRETYRHRSLLGVCSFPSRTKEEHRVYLSQNLVRYVTDDGLEEEDEEEAAIDEEEMETDWNENE